MSSGPRLRVLPTFMLFFHEKRAFPTLAKSARALFQERKSRTDGLINMSAFTRTIGQNI